MTLTLTIKNLNDDSKNDKRFQNPLSSFIRIYIKSPESNYSCIVELDDYQWKGKILIHETWHDHTSTHFQSIALNSYSHLIKLLFDTYLFYERLGKLLKRPANRELRFYLDENWQVHLVNF